MRRCRLPRLGAALGILLITTPAAGLAGQDVVHVSPGQSLQQAIDAAPEGATIVLAAGDHRGPVTIPRRITLRGDAGAVVGGAGSGSVITVAGDGVRIEHLEVRRSGRDLSKDNAGILVLGHDAHIAHVRSRDNLHGIYVRAARRAHLLDNHIIGLAATGGVVHVTGVEAALRDDAGHDAPPGVRSLMGNGLHMFDADGARVERNRIEHVRDGIYVAHTSDAVFRGNAISDSRYGIHYMYSSDNVIADNELWANVAGPALMFSRNLTVTGNLLRDHGGFRAYGLLLQNVESSTIHGNELRGNRVAMRLQNSTANDFRRNRLYGNLAGATLNASSRDNTFTRNQFGFNLHQIELTGPVPSNTWSVDGIGNQWQGAMPMDLNGDGISEWPHNEVDVTADRRERFPVVELLTGSLGLRALEWALARAPLPRTRYISDPHPLIRSGPDSAGR